MDDFYCLETPINEHMKKKKIKYKPCCKKLMILYYGVVDIIVLLFVPILGIYWLLLIYPKKKILSFFSRIKKGRAFFVREIFCDHF
jgi:hypothetical protein